MAAETLWGKVREGGVGLFENDIQGHYRSFRTDPDVAVKRWTDTGTPDHAEQAHRELAFQARLRETAKTAVGPFADGSSSHGELRLEPRDQERQPDRQQQLRRACR